MTDDEQRIRYAEAHGWEPVLDSHPVPRWRRRDAQPDIHYYVHELPVPKNVQAGEGQS